MLVRPWPDLSGSPPGRVATWLQGLRARTRPYEIYLSALLIFAVSRVVVVAGVNFGTELVLLHPGGWENIEPWYQRLLRWDTGWYAGIAQEGYRLNPDPTVASSVAFYPLYPLLSRGVKALLGIDQGLALFLVANVSALIAVLLMAKFIRDELGEETALFSLAFFCFYPASIFLSAGYAEPLCLVFMLAGLMLLTRQRFVLAAAMAGFSLAARSTGIVMIPVILWEMWRQSTGPLHRELPRMALCALLAASGLIAFMVYLAITFGHPFAFAAAHDAWHHGTLPERIVYALTLQPFLRLNWNAAIWFIWFMVLTIWSFGRLRSSVSLFGLATLMLPYLTLGISSSMNRFTLMCVPAFMCLGLLSKGRAWLATILIGYFGALLFRSAALFTQWHWVG